MLRRTFALSLAGLAASLTTPTVPVSGRRIRAVDPQMVTDLRSTAHTYRRAYRSVPAHTLFPLAEGQMQLVQSLRPQDQPDPQRYELMTQFGEMAALAGTVAYLDMGDEHTGAKYLDLAHQVGKAVDNPQLLALALGARAFLTGYSGDSEGGLDYALAAVDHAERGRDRRLHAWAMAVCSEMYASTDDEFNALAMLEASRSTVADVDKAEDWDGIGWYDLAKSDAYEGGDRLRLGQHEQALPLLDAALSGLDESLVRHRCTAHIDRAEARQAAGELDAAVEDAHEALTLLELTHHTGGLERIGKLHRKLRPHRTPATRALAEHLIDTRALLSTSGVPA